MIDLLQHGEAISHNYGLNKSSRIINDTVGYLKDRQLYLGENYTVKIFYEDGTIQDSLENMWYQEERVPELYWMGTELEKYEYGDVSFQTQFGKLIIKNYYENKVIRNIQIKDRQGQLWNSNTELEGIIEVDFNIIVEKIQNELVLKFPIRLQHGQLMSNQLSCHDGGWVGFQKDKEPYCAQGSRYLMGYTNLLSPAVPIFMSGKEFNADYRPLPNLSPDLFGEGEKQSGKWLYGSWLNWSQLENPQKRDMLQDIKQIIRIRNHFPNLIKSYRMGEEVSEYQTIDYQCVDIVPKPYYYKKDNLMILVAANPDTTKAQKISFDFNEILDEDDWKVTILFGENDLKNIVGNATFLSTVKWNIKKDKIVQGGLLVLKIEKN